MRLGLNLVSFGAEVAIDMALVLEVERLGFHSVWTAEAYGSDAVTPAAWIAARTTTIHVGTAIMQIPARTPAMTAMTAMTLDQLSGGRFLLGIGPSGPQVVEGWHGVPYGRPLTRTREYVDIVRRIWAREGALEHEGREYQIPYRGPGSRGLGKPLKSILRGRQLPVYIAAVAPKGVEQAAEIGDGWLPAFYSPYRHVYREQLAAGFRKAGGGKSLASFDLAPTVPVIQGDDIPSCLTFVKPVLALYIGGMGVKGQNFYNDLACRQGFAEAAERIQTLYLDGKRGEAIAAVPDELADEIALVGPAERIRDRLQAWKAMSVGTLICILNQAEAARTLAEAVG